MKTVYRVEKQNKGKWSGLYGEEPSFVACSKFNIEKVNYEAHPCSRILQEVIYYSKLEEGKEFFFGFPSKNSMYSWIHHLPWFQELHEFGYTLNVYEIEEDKFYTDGDVQCIFIKDDAILKETISLLNLI